MYLLYVFIIIHSKRLKVNRFLVVYMIFYIISYWNDIALQYQLTQMRCICVNLFLAWSEVKLDQRYFLALKLKTHSPQESWISFIRP